MRIKFFILRTLLVLAESFLMFWAFFAFINVMNRVIDLHLAILDLMWGVMGAVYCKFAVDFARTTINTVVKYLELYCIANESKDLNYSFTELLKILVSTAVIVKVSKELIKIISSYKDKFKIPEGFKNVTTYLKNSKGGFLLKFAEGQLNLVFDNLDECLLIIAFRSGKDSFVKTLKNGFAFLCDKSIELIKISLNVTIIVKALNFFFFVCYGYLIIANWEWSARYITLSVIMYNIVKLIFEFAIVEPLRYSAFATYCADNYTSDYKVESSVLKSLPSFEPIKKLLKLKDEEDADE